MTFSQLKKYIPLCLLILFTALLMTGCSLNTDDSATSSLNSGLSDGEVSLNMLASILGQVQGIFSTPSTNILGKLFYQFNLGFLVIAGGFMGYSIVLTTVQAAQDGAFSSQSGKSISLYSIRLAAGIAMMTPNVSTGYCLAQTLMLQVAIMGVDLADKVWNAGLQYVEDGNAIWIAPVETSQSNTTPNLLDNTDDFKDIIGADLSDSDYPDGVHSGTNEPTTSLGYTILVNQMCMYAEQIANGSTSPFIDNTTQVAITNSDGSVNSIAEANGGIITQFGTNCGSISNCQLNVADNRYNCTVDSDNADSLSYAQAQNAIATLKSQLAPVAQSLYCKSASKQSTKDAGYCSGLRDTSNDTLAATVAQAYGEYKQNIAPLATDDSKQTGDGIEWEHARDNGWAGASTLIFDLMNAEQTLSATNDFSTYIPIKASPNGLMLAGWDGWWKNTYAAVSVSSLNSSLSTVFSTAKTDVENLSDGTQGSKTQQVAVEAGQTDSVTKNDAFGNTEEQQQQVQGSTIGVVTGSLLGMGVAFGTSAGVEGTLLTAMLGAIAGANIGLTLHDFTYYNVSGYLFSAKDSDQILTLIQWIAHAGSDLFATGITIIMAFTASISMAFGLVGWCTGETGQAEAQQGMITWLTPLILMIAGGCLAVGFTLRFYIPLLPFTIYTFSVISWIGTVLESLVVGPLIAFGVTHPNGEPLLGKSEQAIMLALSVLLRPPLMVIGLFCSILVLNIGGGLIIGSFWDAVVNHMSFDPGKQAGDNIITYCFEWPAYIVLLTMLLVNLTNQSFSLIYALPDKAMQWIGVQTSPGAISAEKAQQSIESSAKAAGSAIGKAAEAGAPKAEQLTGMREGWKKRDNKTVDTGNLMSEGGGQKGSDLKTQNPGGTGGTGRTGGTGA